VKKQRTSSPVAEVFRTGLDVDYDEVPITPDRGGHRSSPKNPTVCILHAGKAPSGVATRTRAAAMKNKKNGLASTTVTARRTPRMTKSKTKHLDTSVSLTVAPAPITSDDKEKARQTEARVFPEPDVSDKINEKVRRFPRLSCI
jgi:hypothetical protein